MCTVSVTHTATRHGRREANEGTFNLVTTLPQIAPFPHQTFQQATIPHTVLSLSLTLPTFSKLYPLSRRASPSAEILIYRYRR